MKLKNLIFGTLIAASLGYYAYASGNKNFSTSTSATNNSGTQTIRTAGTLNIPNHSTHNGGYNWGRNIFNYFGQNAKKTIDGTIYADLDKNNYLGVFNTTNTHTGAHYDLSSRLFTFSYKDIYGNRIKWSKHI